MIYTPQRNPNLTLALIFVIALIGVVGGIFLHPFCIIFASIFWLLYTAILSYEEFEKKKKHHKGIIAKILNPQLRFFIFELLAFLGVAVTVQYGWIYIGALGLLVWLAFSINYHNHLKEYNTYE